MQLLSQQLFSEKVVSGQGQSSSLWRSTYLFLKDGSLEWSWKRRAWRAGTKSEMDYFCFGWIEDLLRMNTSCTSDISVRRHTELWLSQRFGWSVLSCKGIKKKTKVLQEAAGVFLQDEAADVTKAWNSCQFLFLALGDASTDILFSWLNYWQQLWTETHHRLNYKLHVRLSVGLTLSYWQKWFIFTVCTELQTHSGCSHCSLDYVSQSHSDGLNKG